MDASMLWTFVLEILMPGTILLASLFGALVLSHEVAARKSGLMIGDDGPVEGDPVMYSTEFYRTFLIIVTVLLMALVVAVLSTVNSPW